ncbi:MAG TPA: methyltransferase domain-containing protein [Micromonosporaceae bacterium]|jgi:2-polyprenyl-3-methyl-5-hydroxy-6-metoxy-1,4-benzoquinol methylase
MSDAGSTVARYDELAEFYVAEVGDSVSDPGTAALLDLAGSVAGLRVLDLACGHGRVSRELARRGATVTGLDLSAALLAKARIAEREAPLGIAYIEGDVATVDSRRTGPFDGVVCNYGLADIDDLRGALDRVVRALKPGAWFVFSLLHPCFPGWGPDISSAWPPAGYFSEGWWLADAHSSALRRRVGANHRTLSTYLNELAGHGLIVARVVEPHPPAAWLTDRPLSEPVPTFLTMRCTASSANVAKRPG